MKNGGLRFVNAPPVAYTLPPFSPSRTARAESQKVSKSGWDSGVGSAICPREANP